MQEQESSRRVRYDNSNRVVLVTGGANGIGLAICQAFSQSGAIVVCSDISDPAPDSLPSGVHFYKFDVSDETQCRKLVSWTLSEFGTLDVLVNNAAIQPSASYRPIDCLPSEVYHRMVAVNLSGYFYMAKYALECMKKQRSGVVVNVASAQGYRTAREVGVYGPIKAANLMQTRQWGVEYARDGIRVVSVSPGAIHTPMVRANLAVQGRAAPPANRPPIGRIGQPAEVARAVMWLASDDASFITATDLLVDGGLDAFGAFADPFPQE